MIKLLNTQESVIPYQIMYSLDFDKDNNEYCEATH
jgi:hypothetical protein